MGTSQTHQGRVSAVVLAKEAREGKDEAIRELLRRVEPGSFTALAQIIFPAGGMTPIMFNFLCDEYDKWRGISLSAAS